MAVEATWQGGFECSSQVVGTDHVLIGDEPLELGGANAGPNPFALLQLSLANCTIVTVKGEADLLGVTLDDLRVDVKHKQNRIVGGPGDPEQRSLRITALRRSIAVRGAMTHEQAERLLWAAEHCPVSNTLEGNVELRTDLELLDPVRPTG